MAASISCFVRVAGFGVNTIVGFDVPEKPKQKQQQKDYQMMLKVKIINMMFTMSRILSRERLVRGTFR